MALTVPLLVLGRVAGTPAEARRLAQKAIDSGSALDKFRSIVEIQGGDPRVVDDVSRLPSVKQRHLVQAARSGYISRMDAELIGRASVALGAGRDRVEDSVDPAVGILVKAKPGQILYASAGTGTITHLTVELFMSCPCSCDFSVFCSGTC